MKTPNQHRGFQKYDSKHIDSHPELPLTEQVAYQVVLNATTQHGCYDLPLSDMAYWLRSSEDTARRALHQLVKRGLIAEQKANGKSTTYRTKPLADCNPSQIATPCKLQPHPSQIATPINIDIIDNYGERNNAHAHEIEKPKTAAQKPTPDLSFVAPEFMQVFTEWLAYKKERHETYKTPRSLRACYKRLTELADNDPLTAEKIIQQSFANNWAGLFALKNETQYGKQTNGSALGVHAEPKAATAPQPNAANAKPYQRVQELATACFNLE